MYMSSSALKKAQICVWLLNEETLGKYFQFLEIVTSDTS